MLVTIMTADINKETFELEFLDIIKENKGILFKVARTFCPYEEERDDLIQDMTLVIWQSLPKYKRELKLSTWLYRICLNVAISSYRKHSPKKEKNSQLNELTENISETQNEDRDKDEQLRLLNKFINELNDIDKALMLLYLEDKSHTEISGIMGMSVSNVGTKIGRIKDILRKRFINFK